MKTPISQIRVVAGDTKQNCASFKEADAVVADFRARRLCNKIDVTLTWADGQEGLVVLDMFESLSIEGTLRRTLDGVRERIVRGFADAMPGMEEGYRKLEKDMHALFEGYEVSDVVALPA